MNLTPLVFLTFAFAAGAQSNYVVLPAHAIHSIAQCSRETPKIQGTWDPSLEQIASLESHLYTLANLPPGNPRFPTRIANPGHSYRQYVGVIVNGRRLIYVNALTGPEDTTGKPEVAVVCDGGSVYWGVLFDPASATFSDLQTNGNP